jgi:hypothetical protein
MLRLASCQTSGGPLCVRFADAILWQEGEGQENTNCIE